MAHSMVVPWEQTHINELATILSLASCTEEHGSSVNITITG